MRGLVPYTIYHTPYITSIYDLIIPSISREFLVLWGRKKLRKKRVLGGKEERGVGYI